jgi:hypothetical protein
MLGGMCKQMNQIREPLNLCDMKTIIIVKGLLLISLSLLFLNNGNCQEFSTFKKSLIESRIGNTNYYISLPYGYTIRESQEYGFKTAFFFQPPDSTRNPLFNAGIYIGDYPKVIPPMNDSCIVLRRDREILHRHVIWLTFKCDDLIIMQSIFSDSENSELPKLNPFATVKKDVDIEKIFYIFSTMKKK